MYHFFEGNGDLKKVTSVVNWQNGREYAEYTPASIQNLALGASGGNPAGSTFPIKYEVDYVRVYQSK